jgi:hypothetical protein
VEAKVVEVRPAPQPEQAEPQALEGEAAAVFDAPEVPEAPTTQDPSEEEANVLAVAITKARNALELAAVAKRIGASELLSEGQKGELRQLYANRKSDLAKVQ